MTEFQVNTYTTGNQQYTLFSAVYGSPGSLMIVWQSSGQDGSGLGIYGQQCSYTGSAQSVYVDY